MNNYWRMFFLFLATMLLVACSEQETTIDLQTNLVPVGSINVVSSTESSEHATAEFTPNYISAVDLNARFEQQNQPFIFDVRSKGSFEKSHIESALWVPYGKTEETDLARIGDLDLDTEIVTYCGCPRHLSSLQAKFLTGLGYTNVKVLYDGLWVWQDSGFPTIYGEAAPTTVLKFSGKLIKSDENVDQTDVFLRHVKSGQLEAARSNIDGTFGFDFHLYDYQANDAFELMVTKLDSPVVKTLAPEMSDTDPAIQIDIIL